MGLAICAGIAGCGRLAFDPLAVRDASPGETGLGPWSTPVPIPETGLGADDEDPTMSFAMTELFFTHYSTATTSNLYVITRATPADAWSAAQPLSFGSGGDSTPRLSTDDTRLYFSSSRAGGLGYGDIWVATRSAPGQPWGAPQSIPSVNTGGGEKWLSPCSTGEYLMVRNLGADDDLLGGTLGQGGPSSVDELDTTSDESGPFLSADCLTVYFDSNRGGSADIYSSHRATTSSPWDPPTPFPPANDPVVNELDPWMSEDGRTFLFASDRDGTVRIYISTR